MAFLKHSAAAPAAQPHHHHTLHEVVNGLRHKMSEAVVGHRVARCIACHVELAPEDIAQGCCSDKDGCGCRAFSVRCW
jgi:hypothetical protein